MHPATVWWSIEALRNAGEHHPQVPELLQGHGGLAAAILALGQGETGPFAVQPVGLVGVLGLAGLELGVEEGREVPDPTVDLLGGRDAFGDRADWRRSRGWSGGLLIALYIKGCVIVGSSPSLWPNRR